MDNKDNKQTKSPKPAFFYVFRELAAASAVFLLVTFALLFSANALTKTKAPDPGLDAVIVLGCGLDGYSVSLMLKFRLDKAMEYYSENPDAVIVVSGGQGHDELIPEALAMKEYLESRGIPPDAIVMEDESENTRENLLFSKRKLDEIFNGEYTAALVTSDFHILRSARYAEAAGISVQPLASRSVRHLLPALYIREYLALMRYYVLESWL